MSSSKFVAENGIWSTGDSLFQNAVTVNANLTVNSNLLYVGGNLYVNGNQIIIGTTQYATDVLANVPGLKIGNSSVQFNIYGANGVFTGPLSAQSTITVSGGATISNGLSVSNSAIIDNLTVNASPSAGTNAQLIVKGDDKILAILANSASAAYNPLVNAFDTTLIARTSIIDTANLFIGVHSSKNIGIRMNAASADIKISGNTITFGNSGLSVNGSLGTAGYIMYSNGSSAYWAAQLPTGVTAIFNGNGISGGTITTTGTLSAVAANGINVTSSGINVRPGNNQIISNTSGLFIDQSKIGITSLSGYDMNNYIDHAGVNITAGVGLTGGGTITTSRTLSLDTAYVGTISSNNSTYLNGQPSSYYADIPGRLGYTPVQQGGGAGQGSNKVYIGWIGSGSLGLRVDNAEFSSTWPINITGGAGYLNGQTATYYTDIPGRLGYTPVQQGTGIGQGSNSVKLGWSGSRLKATVDSTDLGNILFDGNFDASLSSNGYQRLPSGLIVQWGTISTFLSSGNNYTYYFNTNSPNNFNFPNSILKVFFSLNDSFNTYSQSHLANAGANTSSMTFRAIADDSGGGSLSNWNWLAIGF